MHVIERKRAFMDKTLKDPIVAKFYQVYQLGGFEWSEMLEELVVALSDENASLRERLLREIRSRPPV